MRKPKLILVWLIVLLLSGCVTTPSSTSGNLGRSQYRNVVILGEHVKSEIAKEYANKYNARVLYTPGRGFLSDAVSSSLRGTLGPSRAMRDIINELKSINNTEGEWILIIPSLAEKYFLVVLRNMEDGALLNANATICLVDEPSKNEAIESEVKRVSGGVFTIKHGL